MFYLDSFKTILSLLQISRIELYLKIKLFDYALKLILKRSFFRKGLFFFEFIL